MVSNVNPTHYLRDRLSVILYIRDLRSMRAWLEFRIFGVLRSHLDNENEDQQLIDRSFTQKRIIVEPIAGG
jgi:hypothetical protein